MRLALASAAAVMAVVVAGCSGDDASDAESSQEDTATEQSEVADEPEAEPVDDVDDPEEDAEDDAEEPADPGDGPSDTTPPGTELSLGETAVVPVETSSQSGHVAITVNSVDEGDKDAFVQQFGDDAESLSPYYVQITVENVGTTELQGDVARVRLIQDGDRTTGVSLIGNITDCEMERFRGDGPGTAFDSCVLQATMEGAELAGVRYNEDEYLDDPIIWRL